MTSTIDVASLEEAAGALLDALYVADERCDGFKDGHAPTLVAAFADTGWSVADVLAFGEDSELAGLLPESRRDRELAESKSRVVISPWPTLRADLVRALEPVGNQARPEEDRAMREALHALDVLPQALHDAAPRGAATRVPSSFANVGPLAAPRTLPGDLGCIVYAEGATVFFGESEHGKSLAAQAIAVEAMGAGLRVIHLDGEQGEADAAANYLKLGADPASLASLGLLHYEYEPSINFDAAYLAGLAPDLVIVDSFARLAAARGVTDAAYAAQGNLMNELQAFGISNGCAVLVIDHTTKSPAKGDRHASGSGAKLAAARGQYFFKRERKFSPERVGAVTFTNVKARSGGLPEWMRFECGGEGLELFSFRPALDKSVPADRIELDVLEFVRAQGKPLSRNKIRQGVTGNGGLIDGATDRLVARGALREVRTGVHPKFEVTPGAPES